MNGIWEQIGAGIAYGAMRAMLEFLSQPTRILTSKAGPEDEARARAMASALHRWFGLPQGGGPAGPPDPGATG